MKVRSEYTLAIEVDSFGLENDEEMEKAITDRLTVLTMPSGEVFRAECQVKCVPPKGFMSMMREVGE